MVKSNPQQRRPKDWRIYQEVFCIRSHVPEKSFPEKHTSETLKSAVLGGQHLCVANWPHQTIYSLTMATQS